ncbi:MAG TPA: DUF4340 domain-containing protein [Thermoanaerobaculia bacterium]|nr:DUF4340 domain-containing protein [Thermoanaerobaculia bacterium]
MPTKKLLILSGVFLALLAFVIFFERKQPTSEERAKSAKRLTDVNVEEVASLLVERPNLPNVKLSRHEKNRWVLTGEPDGPADGFAAENLASDLGRLDVVGEVRTDVDPKEFGLDPPKAKVTVTFKDKSVKSFAFGQPIPGTDATAASEGGRFAAVRAAPLTALTKPLDDYRSRSIFETPTAEITRVTVTKGSYAVVVARGSKRDRAGGGWRMEKPVADFASDAFVDRLLGDLASERVSEFPTVPAAELQRVGLSPSWATVKLEKGAEIVATISFGAAKADAGGKLYAKIGDLVVVVDDRVREDLDAEMSAWREGRVLPVDVPALRRVSFVGDELRAGAEKVEGSWRSTGREIPAEVAEALASGVARAEVKSFLPRRTGKAAKDKPLATLELLSEGETTESVISFFEPPPGAAVGALVEVTGRPEPMLVDKVVLDDLRRAAAALLDAASGKPKAPAKAKAGAKAASTPGSGAAGTASPAKKK